jgi:hypothetical protein
MLRLPNLNRVESYEVRFEHPRSLTVDFDFTFPHGPVEYSLERPSESETVLRFEKVAETPECDFFAYNQLRAGILARFWVYDQLVNPVTVERLHSWYDTLLSPVSREGVRADSALAEKLAIASTDLEKLEAIHDYARREIRYVHVARRAHAIVPETPASVLANKYGDCKDRAFLVQTLAARENIEVLLGLVTAGPPMNFSDSSSTHIGLVNHAICVYQSDSGLVFFDPTARYVPLGDLPEEIVGLEVIILDPDNPRKTIIPPPRSEPTVAVDISASLDSLDRGRARLILRGDHFHWALAVQAQKSNTVFQDALDAIVTSALYKIALDSFTVAEVGPDSMSLTAHADLSQFAVLSPLRTYLPRLVFKLVDPDLLRREEDQLPLHFKSRLCWRLGIELTTPGWSIREDSSGLIGDSGFETTTTAENLDTGRVALNYTFHRPLKTMTGEAKSDYLEFCREYLKLKAQMYLLEEVGK